MFCDSPTVLGIPVCLVVVVSLLGELLAGALPDVLGPPHLLVADAAVEPGALHGVARLGDEQPDAVGRHRLVPRVDPDLPALVLPG